MTFLQRLVVNSIAIVALAATGSVFAQTTVPAVPSVTPAPSCEKPGDAPNMNSSELGRAAAEQKRTNWSKSAKVYLECLKRFIDEQQAAAAPHIRAANAGVEEYNKAVKNFNDQTEATKQQ
jgi:hypothetical protein